MKPKLLFLHYFGGSKREWDGVIARLGGRFECVAVDAPGFGDAASVDGFTVQEMVAWLLLLDTCHLLQGCVVVGHSMMGKVAMVAAAQGMNVAGMVLVAPSPLEPEPMTEEARAKMVEARGSEAGAREFFMKGAKRELSEAMIRQGTEDVLRSDAEAWRRWPQSGSREDWSGAVEPIEVPCLVVVGALDEAIPLVFQREKTMGHLKEARLEVLEGVGHLVPYEAAEELSGLIEGFVGEVG